MSSTGEHSYPPSERANTESGETLRDDFSPGTGGLEGDESGHASQESSVKKMWKFRMRPPDDDEPQNWWFASMAIPLLAATIGPLANVLSIAALVTYWREKYTDTREDDDAEPFPDPRWCIGLNAASLACGFAGNIFLLFNFTRVIRYIIALPMTIFLWYISAGILTAITLSMNIYEPPIRPGETYSQGFWYAVIADVLYIIASMILMINMLGYFLGHYPQHFALTDDQRNLILQSMMFFVWLAGGAGIFAKVCNWSYADALYFCDVTILTIGFGDFVPDNDVGRGLVFPYSVGGIIILGLVVSSIHTFTGELSHDMVIKGHAEKKRLHTIANNYTNELVLQEEGRARAEATAEWINNGPSTPSLARQNNGQERTFKNEGVKHRGRGAYRHNYHHPKVFDAPRHLITNLTSHKKDKLVLLREEKDRFDAMRKIQRQTDRFKRWYALTMSVIAFSLLWCVGAIVFWKAEKREQNLSYFEALYFCYVSLLTLGYGDMSPRSNAGKPFFVVWSLVAVPAITILISDMGSTVIDSFKRFTFRLGDWTVLPQAGLWKHFLDRNPWLLLYLQKKQERARIAAGFPTITPSEIDPDDHPPTLEELASEFSHMDDHDRARRLAKAIRRTADDLKAGRNKRYSYEEWVTFTRLIRFSSSSGQQLSLRTLEEEEAEGGIIEWDWIGDDSPMVADQSEPEWILDRLCESLNRYMRSMLPEEVRERRRSEVRLRLAGRSRSVGESIREEKNEDGGVSESA
ncbi:MAG: Potassium channel [Cirrosporium novae-zelandiae]|nr:MAG: Potassium channel [Cirrosporium novae-zelandiae]